eukprot:11370-Heterococcus_DN1.PRE.9
MGFKGANQRETRDGGLVRWIALPIQPFNMSTFRMVSGAAPIGFLIAGDLVEAYVTAAPHSYNCFSWPLTAVLCVAEFNGLVRCVHAQHRSSLIGDTLGGFGGVYALLNAGRQSPEPVQRRWITVSATLNVLVEAGTSAQRAIQQAAVKKQADHVSTATFRKATALSLLALDAAMLLLATSLFLRPLEKMGARIKSGASVDMSHLQQLANRRRWSFTILAAGAASLSVGALMGTWGIQNLKRAIINRSTAEPGILQMSYRRDVDGAIKLMASAQTTATTLAILNGTRDSSRLNYMHERMQYMAEVLQCEIVVLINGSGQVLIAAHNSALNGTTDWNPSRIVSDVLTTGLSFTRSALVPVSELQRFQAPVWTDKLLSATPDSMLHPSVTGAESLVRWTGTPLWINGNGRCHVTYHYHCHSPTWLLLLVAAQRAFMTLTAAIHAVLL